MLKVWRASESRSRARREYTKENVMNLPKRLWKWINEPSAYDIWNEAFQRLQTEKQNNGRSSEYWRIWHGEVCPAYKKLSEETPKFLIWV